MTSLLSPVPAQAPAKPVQGKIKCVVWDLDNTVWDGVLLEDGDVQLRPWVVEHVKRLDAMGVLHSVASKNDHETAMAKLREFGLDEYFLFPRISWNAKSVSIGQIARKLTLGWTRSRSSTTRSSSGPRWRSRCRR
ncbi:HAD-IIIC family phosphatase [Amycolatopsis sp. Hca4]|uniref:HAD-IIIC family phosphatase n=1 Tax=Amycolatopsis sp. Hca4 TaxID=2742131 RepID=UPI0020CAC045|nr:HAD-IIIC family phosphatase [Amycolatopsis sp. Hca4]